MARYIPQMNADNTENMMIVSNKFAALVCGVAKSCCWTSLEAMFWVNPPHQETNGGELFVVLFQDGMDFTNVAS